MKNIFLILKKSILLLITLFFFSSTLTALSKDKNIISPLSKSYNEVFEGNIISNEGAWCWFADPISIHHKNTSGTINNTYIAYIDIHGNIKATQHNFNTGKNNEVLIRSWFQPDDHDVPTFLILPDDRVMIFYSRHTDEARFYYRVSKNPGDITNLGDEKIITTTNNTTYPNPFILSDDPTHIYLCWRGINWHPTIAKLTIPDGEDNVTVTAGAYQIVQSTGARPYAKYFSNGKDKIYLTYTTGHPDNEYPNWVYFNYIDINTFQLKDINGTVLSTIPNGAHSVNKTTYSTSYPNAVVDAPTDQRDWVWQTTLDKDGKPVIAMVRISNDKKTHRYYYAKWNGNSWDKTFISNGGTQFHQTSGVEMCYSGGMTIDEANPNTVYCSVPKNGTNGKKYEIVKYVVGTNGTLNDSLQITSNSALNNSRPFIVKNSEDTPLRLTWMNGNYYYWITSATYTTGYPTDIRSEWQIPLDALDLNNGIIMNEKFDGSITGNATVSNGILVTSKTTSATLSPSVSTAFTISLTPYLDASDYNGTILTMGNLTYGITSSTTPKPFVTIDGITYNSSNVLGTSDNHWNQATLSGNWKVPTKLKYFNLTLTYENGTLKIFRNGLIDQVIEGLNLALADVNIGGFKGLVEDCVIYNRALNQGEVKKLTETSLNYNTAGSTSTDLALLSIPQNIYTDVVMPSTMPSGNTVTWTSSNAAVISTTGLVTFPQNITPVTITATINGQSKTFQSNIYPRDINNNKFLGYAFETADVYTNNGVKYVKDKFNNGKDGIIYGNAVVNGTLNITANTASGFSTNGFVTAPDGTLDKLRSFTFLVKVTPANLNSQPRIFDFGCSSGNSVFLRGSAFTAGFKYNGGTTTLINSSSSITIGTENKLAMTFDAKTKTTKVYHNGNETATSTSIVYEPYQLSALLSNNRNYIGRTQWWDSSVASSNIDYNGTIDDFILYDIALTKAEIENIQSNNFTTISSQTLKSDVELFPNPCKLNSTIKITSKSINKDFNLEIIDAQGKVVQNYQAMSFPCEIKAFTKRGIYLVRAFSKSEILFAGKIVVI